MVNSLFMKYYENEYAFQQYLIYVQYVTMNISGIPWNCKITPWRVSALLVVFECACGSLTDRIP